MQRARKFPLDLCLRWLLVTIASVGMAATVTGPITGGVQGQPFAAIDASDMGYVTEEYFYEGTAWGYELVEGTQPSPDGQWVTRRSDVTAPFKSRLLVVKPRDPAAFNGTVVVYWMNVTAGFELGTARGEPLRGYAWVGVSAQKVGIDGFETDPAGLKAWDPERYESLRHPGDDYSYSIFTQAAKVIGPHRDSTHVDPLSGLEVRHLIAVGPSQSAARLRTYINAVHPLEQLFAGYIPFIDFGRATGFGVQRRAGTLIRADLDVPVIVVNSETEAASYFRVREPDTPRFRYWEVAGTSHVAIPRSMQVDSSGANWLAYTPVYNAAIRHLHLWITEDKEPPTMPRIEVREGSPLPTVVRDEHGNAVGGIRLPDIEVPTASHSGFGRRIEGSRFGFLYGTATDFPREKLVELYPSRDVYLKRWHAASKVAVRAGMLLREDVAGLREVAEVWSERLVERTASAEAAPSE